MKYLAPFIVVIVIGALSYAAYAAYGPEQKTGAQDAEPIKAEILNDDAANFTIDVGSLANSGANTEAKFFAVYVSEDKPADCADFRDADLSYDKPKKHQRRFDLSDHKDILEAIHSKKCVIIPNVPAS